MNVLSSHVFIVVIFYAAVVVNVIVVVVAVVIVITREVITLSTETKVCSSIVERKVLTNRQQRRYRK